MKDILYSLIIFFSLHLFVSSCANPRSPTGGPKDTIPPTLLSSNPTLGTTNFNSETITLEFSEYINADKLTQNLILTPKTDIKYKHVVKKNQVVIKFEEPFSDSTTYSLNFFDGITDITEKTPAINLLLAFSTGNFIDSMRVSGKVNDLLTEEKSAALIVGLYPISDTLDFLTQSPIYFTTTSDSGEFEIPYIKADSYRILAFKDENRNLILDPKEESHGFSAKTIQLEDSSINNILLKTILQDVKPISLINHRPVGQYHEIKFNKNIDSYQLNPDSLYSTIEGSDKDVIRIYNPNQFAYGDSISISVNAMDSLGNSASDTFNIAFLESNRKSTQLNASITTKEEVLKNNPLYTIVFNKPISSFDQTKTSFKADSTFIYYPDSISYEWNASQTEMRLMTYLNSDSLYNSFENSLPNDTLITDSLLAPKPDSIITKVAKSNIELHIEEGAFQSIESDTSKLIKYTHLKSQTKTYGTLKLNINTDRTSFIVQLLNSQEKVSYEAKNNKQPNFNVVPGTYKVRVLIDTDNNGKWSFGNLMQNTEPEEVYLFPEELAIRENWIVEDINIYF